MTLTVVLKVGDGIVLGADSAASLGSAKGVENVYFNAEKVLNIVSKRPVGVAYYGLGGLAGRSMASLLRDLREEFDQPGSVYELPADWTIELVANHIARFIYDEHYTKEYPRPGVDPNGAPAAVFEALGMFVAGYSPGARRPEVWTLEINGDGTITRPHRLFAQDDSGRIDAKGVPEAVFRLICGWSTSVLEAMVKSGVPAAEAVKFLNTIDIAPMVHPAMPIQDAIDLVIYLIDVTCGFVRFLPSAPIVAPPIDVAAITPHQGFRWVRRKHYFSAELNP